MLLKLRALEREDLQQLRDWRNSEALRHSFRNSRLLNMVNQQDWFQRISTSRDVEMFGIEINSELVGVCGLCNIDWVNRTAETSRYLAPEPVGDDGDVADAGADGADGNEDQIRAMAVMDLLIHKAFYEFNIHRLWTEVYPFSKGNIEVLERSGFIREGVLREHVYKQGTHHDSYIYGLLREDVW